MNELLSVLKEVHREPKAFQSDWARSKAKWVAEAASRGLISCLQNGYSRHRWMITTKGMKVLENQGAIGDE